MSETYKVLNQAIDNSAAFHEFSETTIVKWGNSQGIRIPRSLMELMNLSINEKVEISVANNIMYIRKSCQYQNLKERMEAFYQKPIDKIYVESTEEDWGPPQGDEIW